MAQPMSRAPAGGTLARRPQIMESTSSGRVKGGEAMSEANLPLRRPLLVP